MDKLHPEKFREIHLKDKSRHWGGTYETEQQPALKMPIILMTGRQGKTTLKSLS